MIGDGDANDWIDLSDDMDNIDNNVGKMVMVTGAREGELLENFPAGNMNFYYCVCEFQSYIENTDSEVKLAIARTYKLFPDRVSVRLEHLCGGRLGADLGVQRQGAVHLHRACVQALVHGDEADEARLSR